MIADGAEVISDFRVLADQREAHGLVASVPTAWRTLSEIASGGPRVQARMARAVNAARRNAWRAIAARHGAIPGVRVADKVLEGVICIRLDASVVTCHSEKEGAEPNFKGFGLHPLLGYCDNTAEALAGMLRPGSAGSNTTADHLQVLGDAITAVPAKHRRRLMVTCDGAGASHGLIERLDELARRPGHQLVYSVGWELGERERRALDRVPEQAWQIAIDGRGQVRERRADDACTDPGCGHARCRIGEAQVGELTGLLREGPDGDQLAGWPAGMRIFARRERPAPRRPAVTVRGDGRLALQPVGHQPACRLRGWRGQLAYIDAAHRVHARVEDCIRTGKDCRDRQVPLTATSRSTPRGWLSR